MKEQQALKQFIDQVQWLYEPEYGDFKRKLGLYIKRLVETNPALATGEAAKIIESIKTQVVYSPNGDIESTRREILKLATQLLNSTTSSGALH